MAAADGFSLNVANFWPDADVVAFGRAVSARLGGAHFVVDSGRNGNGRVPEETVDGGPSFCNPPGRALGREPTLDTGDPLVDGYLWIKRVGESDGACRPGELPAGQWWPEYALGLAGLGAADRPPHDRDSQPVGAWIQPVAAREATFRSADGMLTPGHDGGHGRRRERT